MGGAVIERLNREHPEYRDRKEMWQRYWDFYVGGEQLRRNASFYLVRRQKEPNDVYAERLARVFYENYLGSCIDWYAAHAVPESAGDYGTDSDSARSRLLHAVISGLRLSGHAVAGVGPQGFHSDAGVPGELSPGRLSSGGRRRGLPSGGRRRWEIPGLRGSVFAATGH